MGLMTVPSAATVSRADGLAARIAAFHLLAAVIRRGVALDRALSQTSALDTLAAADRAFARNLATNCLRRLGQIDAVLDRCLATPLPNQAWKARLCLRMGIAQCLYLDTPDHAVVHAGVALAESLAGARYKAITNAILRRLTRDPDLRALGFADPAVNTPDWLRRRWIGCYGPATAGAIAEAHLAEPPLDLTVKADPDRWAARLDGEVIGAATVRCRMRGPVTALPGFETGDWWVQDHAATLPVALIEGLAGKTVIDLCAAPGGKTAQLAAGGAEVVAVERSQARFSMLRENLDRLRLTASAIRADAIRWRPREPADAVLVDAPCTATGTIRRHPDIPWLKAPADLARTAAVQDRLLAAAMTMVRPGGLVIFATCSLEPEEGPDRISAALAGTNDFVRLPVRALEIGGHSDWISADGDLRTLPCHLAGRGGLDGFFAARLKRVR